MKNPGHGSHGAQPIAEPPPQTIASDGFTETQVLQLAASLEQASEHPLAAAIVTAARAEGLVLSTAASFESRAGSGVFGAVATRALAIGSAALMTELGISIASLQVDAKRLSEDGASVMYLACDQRLAGLLAVSDPIKATTPEALATLKRAGVDVILATGDGLITVQAIGRALGIAEVHAEVLPAMKLALVRRLQAAGRVVAMAGDGTNDAPALAQADVGIAMGTGTDVAMKSGQVTLVKGDLRGVATVANMRQNLTFALVYNALRLRKMT